MEGTFGMIPLPATGNRRDKLQPQGRDKGKDSTRYWIPAQWTVMVPGKAPDPAVDWNTKQEIKAEVW